MESRRRSSASPFSKTFPTAGTFLILFASFLQGGEPPLIDVQKLAPGIVVEMRYATTNNFTGKILYDSDRCYLNEPAARRLARVQKKLEKEGLSLKIWDCYRPVSVQWTLWETVSDPRYVADPRTGSRHNRGASIDCTLVDNKGNELPMPTGFDDFGPKAHRNYKDLPADVLRNRKKLEAAMTVEGFFGLPTEWWHFDDPEWKNYELRNEPLSSPSLTKDRKTQISKTHIPKEATQLVRVLAASWDSGTATLQRFEKSNRKWMNVGPAIPVSLGSSGLAWGQGLHAAFGGFPHKREGDRRTSAGLYKIGSAYGYAENPPGGVSWPYQFSNEEWRCVDDPKSSRYNRIVNANTEKVKDWSSAETMRRTDGLYKWVINIEQNYPSVLKGAGSCIFFHVWRRKNSPTRGCVAMEENNIVELMSWLRPDAHPHVVILPKSAYGKIKKKWGLP